MTIQQIPITSPEGVTLATARKYCPRNLHVVPALADLTVTENGTYTVPEGYAGIRSVTVRISTAGGGSTDPDEPGIEIPEEDNSGEGGTDTEGGTGGETACTHPAEALTEQILSQATCTAAGTVLRTCTACGHTETVSIPAEAHRYTETVVPPTCEEEGYTVHTCTLCGASYADTAVPATGHTYTAVEDPDSESGTRLVCSVCGATA